MEWDKDVQDSNCHFQREEEEVTAPIDRIIRKIMRFIMSLRMAKETIVGQLEGLEGRHGLTDTRRIAQGRLVQQPIIKNNVLYTTQNENKKV